ncbi:hypothetical protein BDQ17DRAFT_1354368 [Cyathus striatus]|nr:hypothetical protein BDQ17DRAFT_1354368 [Cyathus striatus]
MPSILTLILSALGAFSVSRAYKILGYLRPLKGLPHSFILFHPFDFPGLIIPSGWWNAGADCGWKYRLRYRSFCFSSAELLTINEALPL